MAEITLKGNKINTIGFLPEVGTEVPDFSLVNTSLAEVTLADYKGKKLVLNIFPSLDTGICAASIRRFNAEASKFENTEVLCISMDLPFAHSRFCTTDGLDKVSGLSGFRNSSFGEDYGVTIVEGGFSGLYSRAVVVVNEEGKVIYKEQVPEIAQEPNYEAAIAALK
ncbi:thiol peroxidase [Ignavibacteriales bacterium]